MRQKMKHFAACMAIVCLGIIASACENKRDDNGDLGGMWQMTLWTDANGDTVATKYDRLFYYFQLDLMKVQRPGYNEYLARFSHQGDSLFVGATYAQPFDSVVSREQLTPFGIPANGRMHIDGLSDSRMQLSGSLGTLRFRKY